MRLEPTTPATTPLSRAKHLAIVFLYLSFVAGLLNFEHYARSANFEILTIYLPIGLNPRGGRQILRGAQGPVSYFF